MPYSLQEWLDYQQKVHALGVDLGLARASEVWRRMGAPRPAATVVTVAGTNGKGSTVALLEAIWTAAGYRVGAYTSPHLLRYNERVRVDGADAADASLIAAFDQIEQARETIPLTYFEFGTLAALWLFAQAGLDVAVLEVGLGGRLDAVNIVDADAVAVTTIALDHQDWLGNDRDTIGREKAGVARRDRIAVVSEAHPPDGLLRALAEAGARVHRAGVDFQMTPAADGWHWTGGSSRYRIPPPALAAPCQPQNIAGAVALVDALQSRMPVLPDAIIKGVAAAQVAGRLQRVRVGDGELVIDVAHNPQAAGVLAEWLAQEPSRPTMAVFSALADKDIAGIVRPLADRFVHWHLSGLDSVSDRGRTALTLANAVAARLPYAGIAVHATVEAALDAVAPVLRDGARVVAFGSFFVAADALRWAARHSPAAGSDSRVKVQG
ncbi:bifunctional tetrahydrofolate synthase/dihydrofolate synthase [Tahibacter amnicola]|uniref:Dihydrofolate synthase/folylpolyglutamate synthase n=1 Tax=Tahibacter amnicola TaxID=2976241 RepID=A0ABY6BCN8_9GAMM|nr:bifunctional tetrahydrofolate synthase/dihydrofolate synthase [Tahibacter amnicola]UXI66958.1 bifunctional tetrahydrofolate synthase/dihydrofolate synthase [Tahibacter amnicola]